MVDKNSRLKLFERQQHRELMGGLENIKPNVDINKMFMGLQNSISKLAQESKISIPESFRINKIDAEIKIKDWADLIDAMEELKKGFNLLLNKKDGYNITIPDSKDLEESAGNSIILLIMCVSHLESLNEKMDKLVKEIQKNKNGYK